MASPQLMAQSDIVKHVCLTDTGQGYRQIRSLPSSAGLVHLTIFYKHHTKHEAHHLRPSHQLHRRLRLLRRGGDYRERSEISFATIVVLQLFFRHHDDSDVACWGPIIASDLNYLQ